MVLLVRRTLEKRQVGLIGARAVRQEVRQYRLLARVPALATINRWLKAAGLQAVRAVSEGGAARACRACAPRDRLRAAWQGIHLRRPAAR